MLSADTEDFSGSGGFSEGDKVSIQLDVVLLQNMIETIHGQEAWDPQMAQVVLLNYTCTIQKEYNRN